jgi:ornithine carbamoyltransferase
MSNNKSPAVRHFIDLRDIEARDLRLMIQAAKDLKWERARRNFTNQLSGRTLCMIFEKNSTRTRISFELAMAELGGYVMSFNASELQLGRGETLSDTAKVMSRYVHALMVRANEHQTVTELAANSSIPVINGLTNVCHPCQILADILTIEEMRGDIKGKTIAWVGDGNNVANTLISAAVKFEFTLKLACPQALQPNAETLGWAKAQGANIELHDTPNAAVQNADAVITDTWVSMGDKDAEQRIKLLTPYQVHAELMALAKPDALFLHCMPAHRGEEVTAEVIDGSQSVVFDEAENRLHVQKSVLLWCFKLI